MKKILAGLLGVLLCVSIVMAAPVVSLEKIFSSITLTTASNNTTIAVNGTETVWSKSFPTPVKMNNVCITGLSSGGPDLLIQIEQSRVPCINEGASDSNFVIPNEMTNIGTSLTSTSVWHQWIEFYPLTWSRLKITGNAANAANTTIQLWISSLESN